MAAAPERADSTASENYGEVLGSERYRRFNYLVRKNDATFMAMDENPVDVSINKEAYFNNRYYYYYYYYDGPISENINGGYLCSSREDGTDVKVITNRYYFRKIFVNHSGIYIIEAKNSFTVINFKGEELFNLEIDETVIDYYICDTK